MSPTVRTGMSPETRPVREDERGTVLVLVVILTTLILVIVADARHVARIEWEAASNADIDFQLQQAVEGGYQIAEAYLRQDLQDSPEIDHSYEEWAAVEGITKDFDPSQYGGSSFYDAPQNASNQNASASFPQVRIFIEDEERKYPLPLLRMGSDTLKDRRKESLAILIQWFRANTQLSVDPSAAAQYADMIVNFISRIENDTSFGPTPRPGTKQGMILAPKDLALIPGIPEDLIFDAVDDDGAIAKGLMHYLTIWSDLAVNINTAEESVLRAVMRPQDQQVGYDIWAEREKKGEKYREYESDMVDRFGADWRRSQERLERGTENETEEEDDSAGYWTEVDELKDDVDTVTERVLQEIRLYTGVTSKVFSIWVEASMRGIKLRRRWVVRREGARLVLVMTEQVSYPFFRYLTEDEMQDSYDSNRGW